MPDKNLLSFSNIVGIQFSLNDSEINQSPLMTARSFQDKER